MNYKKLWLDLIAAIENGQTSWGKQQLLKYMKELELEGARDNTIVR